MAKAEQKSQHAIIKSSLYITGVFLVFLGFAIFISDAFRIPYSVGHVMIGFVAIIAALVYAH